MKIIKEIKNGYTISSPDTAVEKYLKEFEGEDREYFIVLGLNTKNTVVYREIVSIGTLDSGILSPREVFKKAIIMSCKSIIIAHNHPSGDPEPSPEDDEVTNTIKNAADIIGISLLDHLIIGEGEYYSYKNEGKLDGQSDAD